MLKKPERYQAIGTLLADKYGDEASESIPVKQVPVPDLTEILELDRHDHFSIFIPKHQYIAGQLISIFLGSRHLSIISRFFS